MEDDEEPKVEYVAWLELNKEREKTEVLFLRVPSRLKIALAKKADTDGISLNEYCARVLASSSVMSLHTVEAARPWSGIFSLRSRSGGRGVRWIRVCALLPVSIEGGHQ